MTNKYDYLLSEKIITNEDLLKAGDISNKTDQRLETVLMEEFHVNKAAIGQSLSLYHNCPFRSYSRQAPLSIDLFPELSRSALINQSWVPIGWDNDGIEVLIDDPGDQSRLMEIKFLLNTAKVKFSVGLREDIEDYINQFFDQTHPIDLPKEENVVDDLYLITSTHFDDEENAQGNGMDQDPYEMVELADQIIIDAYKNYASDIHIEPSASPGETIIRFRFDGVCQEYLRVPSSDAREIVSKIKSMANLDLAETRLPQNGKIIYQGENLPDFELRVTTYPTDTMEEDVVLRLLPMQNVVKLSQMALSERNLAVLKRALLKPYGLFLSAGPSGSGTTNFLHAIINHINRPGLKILTAEDHIEIKQWGVRQVKIDPTLDFDFASAVRSFLRADPDVIMIGRMCDGETASLGIGAALTGHLILSALYSNSSAETVIRLLDMGLNPLDFSDAILGVMAQRLARRLCSYCREKYHPSRDEFKQIENEYGSDQFAELELGYNSEITLYHAVGCDKCWGTGYINRIGIHELMEATPEIKSLIKKQATTAEVLEQARKDGMPTLKQDGILKVFDGLTDMSEVRRVCLD